MREPTEPAVPARSLLTALGAAAFVVAAVAAEVLGGLEANSPVPAWAEGLVPLSWPAPVRVAWWLGVAGAAAGFRRSLSRLGYPQRRWVVVLSVAPFVAFALGIVAGADWATWH